MLKPVPRSTAQQAAYRQLRAALRDGAFPPGTQLTNRELAARLHISVTPVREAIGRLASEGALVLRASGTAMVPTLDWASINQLLWLGRVVGARVIEDTAPLVTPAALKRMRDIAAQVDALRPPFDGTVAQLLRLFYGELFVLSPLDELTAMIDRLWVRIGPLHAHLNPGFYEAEETRHYHSVLDALASGSGLDAADAFTRFLERVAAFLQAKLDAHE